MDQHGFLLSDAAWKRGQTVILTLAAISWARCSRPPPRRNGLRLLLDGVYTS
jgi:hypothetical protein